MSTNPRPRSGIRFVLEDLEGRRLLSAFGESPSIRPGLEVAVFSASPMPFAASHGLSDPGQSLVWIAMPAGVGPASRDTDFNASQAFQPVGPSAHHLSLDSDARFPEPPGIGSFPRGPWGLMGQAPAMGVHSRADLPRAESSWLDSGQPSASPGIHANGEPANPGQVSALGIAPMDRRVGSPPPPPMPIVRFAPGEMDDFPAFVPGPGSQRSADYPGTAPGRFAPLSSLNGKLIPILDRRDYETDPQELPDSISLQTIVLGPARHADLLHPPASVLGGQLPPGVGSFGVSNAGVGNLGTLILATLETGLRGELARLTTSIIATGLAPLTVARSHALNLAGSDAAETRAQGNLNESDAAATETRATIAAASNGESQASEAQVPVAAGLIAAVLPFDADALDEAMARLMNGLEDISTPAQDWALAGPRPWLIAGSVGAGLLARHWMARARNPKRGDERTLRHLPLHGLS